jgi:hypothetical protein
MMNFQNPRTCVRCAGSPESQITAGVWRHWRRHPRSKFRSPGQGGSGISRHLAARAGLTQPEHVLQGHVLGHRVSQRRLIGQVYVR